MHGKGGFECQEWWELSPKEARRGLKQGRALAVAKCDSEEVNKVADLMRSHGAVDVKTS